MNINASFTFSLYTIFLILSRVGVALVNEKSSHLLLKKITSWHVLTPLFFFVSVAELEYGNSYEIEYMEKIGSSVPVSSHLHFHSFAFPCHNILS